MKSMLRVTTALAGVAFAGSAFAADLPRRAAPPPVFTPVPVFTWTGAYFGINAGYAFDASDRNTGNTFAVPFPYAAPGTVASFRNRSQDGFSGGGQIGYNYQFTPGSGVVIGFEADAQYLDFGRNRNNAFVSGAVAPGYYLTDPRGLSSLDFFGTVRGRLGYAFDRTLVYGTGGFAYGSGSADRSFGGFAGDPPPSDACQRWAKLSRLTGLPPARKRARHRRLLPQPQPGRLLRRWTDRLQLPVHPGLRRRDRLRGRRPVPRLRP
ncbi:hypothetical protein [Methylobacterium mesophilicum]|uniref:outer membrane protein n=1 Tax=Methylobacterium mesophilicum TaxID=39956 RepID=UPI002F35422C